METVRQYLKLFRAKHWVKNLLVLLPVFCAGRLLDVPYLLGALLGSVLFTAAVSGIYGMNDVCDAELDRRHPSKRHRPVASGAIGKPAAAVCSAVLMVTAPVLSYLLFGPWAAGLLIVYIATNVGYSAGLKRVPVVDVLVLALGFVIRVLYGSVCAGLRPSVWLCLVIGGFSLYLSFGKRHNELTRVGAEYRPVLRKYSAGFLRTAMGLSLCLANLSFAGWAVSRMSDGLTVFLPAAIPFMIWLSFWLIRIQDRRTGDSDMVSYVLSCRQLIAAFALLMGTVTLCVYIR